MVREEGFGSLARGVTPNVFRSILMNASQLASWVLFSFFLSKFSILIFVDKSMGSFRYDFFKTELLKTPYFEDNIVCHFAASFATVRPPLFFMVVYTRV